MATRDADAGLRIALAAVGVAIAVGVALVLLRVTAADTDDALPVMSAVTPDLRTGAPDPPPRAPEPIVGTPHDPRRATSQAGARTPGEEAAVRCSLAVTVDGTAETGHALRFALVPLDVPVGRRAETTLVEDLPSDGRLEFTPAGPGRWAWTLASGPEIVRDGALELRPGPNVLFIDLTGLPSFVGRVVDAYGLPRRQARVSLAVLALPGRAPPPTRETSCDFEGRFRFAGVQPQDVYRLTADDDGFAQRRIEPLLVRRPGVNDLGDVTLPGGGRAVVRVFDEQGAPFTGCPLVWSHAGDERHGETDDEGLLVIDGLGDDALSVRTEARGHLDRRVDAEPPFDPPVDLVIALSAGRTLRGRAVYDDGSPYRMGRLLGTVDPSTGAGARPASSLAMAVVMPDGAFEMGPFDAERVRVTTAVPGEFEHVFPVDTFAEVVVPRETSRQVRVHFTDAHSGAPVSTPFRYWQVTATSSSGPRGEATDEAGDSWIRLAPSTLRGDQQLFVAPDDYASVLVERVPSDGVIELALESARALEVTLLGEDAAPIVGASVALFWSGPPTASLDARRRGAEVSPLRLFPGALTFARGATSDTHGVARFDLPLMDPEPKELRVLGSHAGHLPAMETLHTTRATNCTLHLETLDVR
ncbi:MAG: carboxypeptidase regulatory-like domain-containing protein [Planctomycetes bacterium]|nr:carboxypeptidase regulatory-like domain-containing protein [Planctomycetota bacterium]